MATWGRKPSCRCGSCSKCKHAAYMRDWYRRRSLEERRVLRAQRDPDRVRATDRARHGRMRNESEYQRRRAAVSVVNNAIRDGRLVRQPCRCGATAQAHHDDYDKPLDRAMALHDLPRRRALP